jgi:hypothetical protein
MTTFRQATGSFRVCAGTGRREQHMSMAVSTRQCFHDFLLIGEKESLRRLGATRGPRR